MDNLNALLDEACRLVMSFKEFINNPEAVATFVEQLQAAINNLILFAVGLVFGLPLVAALLLAALVGVLMATAWAYESLKSLYSRSKA